MLKAPSGCLNSCHPAGSAGRGGLLFPSVLPDAADPSPGDPDELSVLPPDDFDVLLHANAVNAANTTRPSHATGRDRMGFTCAPADGRYQKSEQVGEHPLSPCH